jgi:hypothetical protein
MAAYNIQSQLTDKGGIPLVIDIQGAVNTPNTPLDAFTPNGGANQLWTLVLDAASGYHFIQSNLKDPKGNHLVIDIRGAINTPGTLLDAFTKKTKNYDNQLWQFVEGPPGWYFIQSKLKDPKGNPLVIDVQGATGAISAPGTPLDAFTQKSKNNANQLWQLAG